MNSVPVGAKNAMIQCIADFKKKAQALAAKNAEEERLKSCCVKQAGSKSPPFAQRSERWWLAQKSSMIGSQITVGL